MRWLERYSNYTYALLRIFAGAMLAFHGSQKILGILSDFPRPPVGSQLWLGGIIELVGGTLVALGFQTRLAAFLLSGTMAVAYFQFHWKLQLGRAFFPAINKGELAVIYCFVFLYLASRGGGAWSVDRRS